MAWRPTEYLIEGELDNTTPGKVAGWMKFLGKRSQVKFDLRGDFHRDIRGAKIRFHNEQYREASLSDARKYFRRFRGLQAGAVGDITAGLPPHDYVKYCYIEWYGLDNGRVVIELNSDQVQVIGTPIPWQNTKPIDRREQAQHMQCFVMSLLGPERKGK